MSRSRLTDILYPAVFGIGVLILWQLIVKGFGVPAVLLPVFTLTLELTLLNFAAAAPRTQRLLRIEPPQAQGAGAQGTPTH